MYFWRVGALKDDIVNGRLSEGERFKYLIYGTVVGAALDYLEMTGIRIGIHGVELAVYIANSVILVAGTYLVYRPNRDGDNVDFLGRFLALSVPVFSKILALGLVLFLVIDGFTRRNYPDFPKELLEPLLMMLYLTRVYNHIVDIQRRLATPGTSPGSSPATVVRG